ncbi:hypothetical protein B484DRAFT_428385, partial [Ochromonadaceae sp. CCMP2298]
MSQPGEHNSGEETDYDRLHGSQDTPATPAAVPPPFTQLGPEDIDPATEQQRLRAADTLQQERMALLINHLCAFRQGSEDADWDGDAYEALTRIPGLSMGPLAKMIGHAAAVRLQLDDFEAAQTAIQAKLDAVTFERNRLR